MTRTSVLTQIPLFSGLDATALELLGGRASWRTVPANSYLFRAGDPAPGLMVILQGRVRVFREVSGRRAVLHIEGPGGTLCDIPTFAAGTLPASAMALEPTQVLVVPRPLLDSLVVLHPPLALKLLERMARRVREVVARLDRQVFEPVATRLARYVMARSERSRTPQAFTLGLTQQALAEELGTVREVLVRELFVLRQSGVIKSLGRGRLAIIDADALQRIATGASVTTNRGRRTIARMPVTGLSGRHR